MELGHMCAPFIHAVADALREESNAGVRLLSLFLRLSIVAVMLMALYGASSLLQMVIGKEIFVEQEVVVVEEISKSRAKREGITEGEKELSIQEAREKLGDEALSEAMGVSKKAAEEKKETEEDAKPKRRSARDKKTQ